VRSSVPCRRVGRCRLAASMAVMSSATRWRGQDGAARRTSAAQAPDVAVKQVAGHEKSRAGRDRASRNWSDHERSTRNRKPDPRSRAARRRRHENGFALTRNTTNVSNNLSWCLPASIRPARKYVAAETGIRRRSPRSTPTEEVAKDKRKSLDDLNKR